MRIEKIRKVEILLFDNDIDSMRAIIKLAANKLNDSEVIHMRGSGIPRQAGLCGAELMEMREMIESIGIAVEADITLHDLSIPRHKFSPISKEMSLVEVES